MKLKNNFIFATVKTGYSNKQGLVTEKHLRFYNARSKHIAAVTPEPLYIDKGLRELPTQMGISDKSQIEGLKKLTNLLHKNGAKAIAHLNHPGRMANPKIPGNYFVSASPIACPNGGAKPEELDKQGMLKVKSLFVNAAKNAEKANFDFIELQFGHGYLFAQFISQAVNNRNDQYGGSFENRIKFPLEVLQEVKNVVNIEIIARISGEEMTAKGFKIAEMQKFAKILQQKGVSAVHVSAGTACSTPPWFFQHMFVPKGKTWEFANKIKEVIDIPVIYVGQINNFEDIDKILNQYKGDYVAFGRPLIADPDYIGKYLGKVKGNVRPCLACSEGCLGGVKSGKGLGCTVNPLVGKENFEIKKTAKTKNIAVVGGGLAGMTAAINLKKRGHNVTLFEKDKLGGQFNLAYLPPHKKSLRKIIDYMANELRSKKIDIVYEQANNGKLNNFDEIIIATGSKPAIPPIKGLKKYYWAEVLEEHNLPENKNTLVIGGGLIGTEVANKLLSKGNKVYIVEMLDKIARGMEMIEQKLTLNALKNNNVNIFVNTKVQKIDGKKVFIEGKEFKQTIDDINVVVLATGMKPYNPFENEKFDKPFHLTGDAAKIGKAQNAIEDAFYLTNEI